MYAASSSYGRSVSYFKGIAASGSIFSLKFSLRNSTAMNVNADAGMYHIILGTLPLNKPLAPSDAHVFLIASSHPSYLIAQQKGYLLP